MTIIDDLQKLDALIIEHTRPPVTPILRRQLQIITEQAEAYQAASDKQDHTLATQIETIERLMKENANLITTIAKLQTPDNPPTLKIIRQDAMPPIENFL
jgi:hypothetical protein